MVKTNTAEWYLTKAKEADAIANQSEDKRLKESWSAIAEGYRELAKAAQVTASGSYKSFRRELP
jgi:hypothetical protein